MNILELIIASFIFISATAATSSSLYHIAKATKTLQNKNQKISTLRSIRAHVLSNKLSDKEIKAIINLNLNSNKLEQLNCTKRLRNNEKISSLQTCEAQLLNSTREFKIWKPR